jgi:hypothetical protein
VAIFKKSARQRLRTATRESLTIPTFAAAVDCTPWVTGGLWPAELFTITDETAPFAERLDADLQHIIRGANSALTGIKQAKITDPNRRPQEMRIVAEARARAAQRVQAAVHQIQSLRNTQAQRSPASSRVPETDLEMTRVLPALTNRAPMGTIPAAAPPDPHCASVHEIASPPVASQVTGRSITDYDPPRTSRARHRAPDDDPTPTTASEAAEAPESQRINMFDADVETTRVLPAVTDTPSATRLATDAAGGTNRSHPDAAQSDMRSMGPAAGPPAADPDEPEISRARHRAPDSDEPYIF